MTKQYPVVLLPVERAVLGDLLAAGTAPTRTLTHARVLLKADQGEGGPAWPDTRIAEAAEVSAATSRGSGGAGRTGGWTTPSTAARPAPAGAGSMARKKHT